MGRVSGGDDDVRPSVFILQGIPSGSCTLEARSLRISGSRSIDTAVESVFSRHAPGSPGTDMGNRLGAFSYSCRLDFRLF